MVQAHVGPVCHALQHSTSVVFCPPPERSSVGRGLLLPPSSRAQEGRGSLSQNDPLGSLVDLLAWVPRPDPACSGRSSKLRPGSQGPGSAPVRNSSRESRRAVADGMALVHGSLRLSGASPESWPFCWLRVGFPPGAFTLRSRGFGLIGALASGSALALLLKST